MALSDAKRQSLWPAKRQQELTEVEDLKRQVAELQEALKQQPEPAKGKAKLSRAELNAEQQRKLRTAVRMEHSRLQQRFKSEVAAEVERRCAAAMAKIDSYLTEDEYQCILDCLQPDRAPEDRKQGFAKAFAIFKRLATYLLRSRPLSVLRERGWAKR